MIQYRDETLGIGIFIQELIRIFAVIGMVDLALNNINVKNHKIKKVILSR
jgi:hypothetical protein